MKNVLFPHLHPSINALLHLQAGRSAMEHLQVVRLARVSLSSNQGTNLKQAQFENIFRVKHYETYRQSRGHRFVRQNMKMRPPPKTNVTPFGYVILPQASQYLCNRTDDVFFFNKQRMIRHTFSDAVSALKAYDLFGGQHVRLVLRLNMDLEKMVIPPFKGLINFPKSLSPQQIVLVFAEGSLAAEAKVAGASIVGGEELIPQVENCELEFDHALSSLDFLPKIRHLPRILKSKMPNTRRGSATNELASTIPDYLTHELYEVNRFGVLTQVLGNTSFTHLELRTNFDIIMSTVANHKHPAMMPASAFFKMVSLEIPPGPRFHLNFNGILPDSL